MGVRDLTSVVKKLAPGCITPVASLRSFAGRRFAIDANLLSTKFFFVRAKDRDAPSFGSTRQEEEEEIRRHLARSWYYFLLALRKEGIRPIVVFDGQSRVKEKEKENERRRKARELQRLRGKAEGLRGGRLREIQEVWEGLKSDEERDRVAAAFREGVTEGDRRREEEAEIAARQALYDIPPAATTVGLPPPPRYPPDSPALLPSQERTAVDDLYSLHSSFRLDSVNPVYSKNQVLLVEEERAFFDSLLTGEPTSTEISPSGGPPSLLSGEGREAPGDLAEELPSEVQERAQRYYEELEDIIERSDKLGRSHANRSVAIPKSAFQEVQALIRALGIPYLEPSPSEPHEAEGVCSALYALGLVDYVVSEDLDVVVYDAPLLRRITTSANGGRSKGKEPMAVVDPIRMRELLDLTREEFVDWALLCGTDFTERIPFLGPMTSLKLIRQHSSIEAILDNTDGKYVPVGNDVEAYLQTVRDARAIFLSLPRIAESLGYLDSSPTSTSNSSVPSPALSAGQSPNPPSTFSGSLDLRPPTSELPAILRRLGIRRGSRYLHPPLSALERSAAGRPVTQSSKASTITPTASVPDAGLSSAPSAVEMPEADQSDSGGYDAEEDDPLDSVDPAAFELDELHPLPAEGRDVLLDQEAWRKHEQRLAEQFERIFL
ncbi:hypothetical protein JCM11251_001530 [Rhodosporidiobolus azoricus]